jgi:hypothetical protein
MLDAMTQQLLQRARVLAVVLVDRKQQVESAHVDGGLVAQDRVLEIHPSFEGVEHRSEQARDHGAAVTRVLTLAELDHDRAERTHVIAPQRGDERRQTGGRALDLTATCNRIGRTQTVE